MLKTWERIPAMAVISATIRSGTKHLLSVLIAVFILASMWAGAGMILFGHQIPEYTRFGTALHKTFKVVLVADHSMLEDMEKIAPAFAVIWHWSLLVVMYIVVLNIVLAILVQSFEEGEANL